MQNKLNDRSVDVEKSTTIYCIAIQVISMFVNRKTLPSAVTGYRVLNKDNGYSSK